MRCYDFLQAAKAVEGTDVAIQAIGAKAWTQCVRDADSYVVNSATTGNLHDAVNDVVFETGFADGNPSIGLCAPCLYNLLKVLEPVSEYMLFCPISPDMLPTASTDICTYDHATSQQVTVYDPARFQVTVTPKQLQTLNGFNIWQDDVLFIPDNTRDKVGSGAAKYLLITPPLNRELATGALFPASFARNEQFVLNLHDAEPRVTRRTFTMPGGAGGTLDLVIASGGHGGIGRLFANAYTAAYVDTNVVGPLVSKGYQAEVIVLDACLTASMIPGFKKLLTSNGSIYCTMYSTSTRIASPDVWDVVKPVLANRATGYQTVLKGILERRMKDITHGVEATAYLEDIRSGTETDVANLLKLAPGARGHISVVRYLRRMIDARDEYAKTQNPGGLHALATNDNAADADKGVVAPILNSKDDPTTKAAALESALRKRALDVLTGNTYGSLEKASDVEKLPLSGDNSLGTVLSRDAERILALAPLPPLPTQFAIYTVIDNTLKYDELIDSDTHVQKVGSHTGEDTPGEVKSLKSSLGASVKWSPEKTFLR